MHRIVPVETRDEERKASVVQNVNWKVDETLGLLDCSGTLRNEQFVLVRWIKRFSQIKIKRLGKSLWLCFYIRMYIQARTHMSFCMFYFSTQATVEHKSSLSVNWMPKLNKKAYSAWYLCFLALCLLPNVFRSLIVPSEENCFKIV